MATVDSIGSRLAQARESRGWNQADLAKDMGVPAARISEWENGKYSPSVERLGQLAAALNVSTDQIIYGFSGRADTASSIRKSVNMAGDPRTARFVARQLRVLAGMLETDAKAGAGQGEAKNPLLRVPVSPQRPAREPEQRSRGKVGTTTPATRPGKHSGRTAASRGEGPRPPRVS